MSQDPMTFPTYAEPPRQRGCFFYGCLTCVILFVVGVGGVATLMYVVTSRAAQMLLAIADDAPVELPKVSLSPEDRAKLDARVKAFREALDAGKTPEPLVLNSDELNTLISELGDETLPTRVHVEIVGDRVEGRLSLPLEPLNFLGLFGLKGKYVNAKGVFSISLQDELLLVRLTDAEVKGKPVPDPMMTSLRNDNLAKNAYQNPENAARLRKIESIVVKDGKVTITAKGPDDKKLEAKPKDEPKPEAKPKDEPKPEAKPKDEPKPEAKPKDEPKPEAKPKDEPKPEAKPKDEPKPKS